MIAWPILLAGILAAADADDAVPNRPMSITVTPAPSRQAPPLTAQPATESVDVLQDADESVPTGRRISPRTKTFRSREDRNVDETAAKTSPSGRQLSWWISTALGLVFVLTVIFFAGRALRGMVPGLGTSDLGGPIHILHRSFLSPKHSVCLIRCGDRLLLVGLSGERMNTLAEITDPQEIEYLKGQCMQVRPNSTTRAFRDLFSRDKSVWNEPAEQRSLSQTKGADAPPTGDFARQLNAVRDKILAWKARSAP